MPLITPPAGIAGNGILLKQNWPHLRRYLLLIINYYYRAMHFSAKRGIAIACRLSVRPSVRLSVCLSVCNVGEL